ncbi:cytochrome P450 [Phanerochaete sordida]|uniref:Cytochrome P450 n=1 Tax=Phanerochaete sordida TaxID=48140 RepID=A0A9P3GML9_9APHY|nr:cytochrome P450 [Phanerochaete sordida]
MSSQVKLDNISLSHSPADPAGSAGTPSLIAYLAYVVPVALLLYSLFSPTNLRHIPTEGASSLPLLSYIGVRDYLRDAKGVLQRGYTKHKGKVFKVAFTDRWLVVVTGKKLVDELQRLPDDAVSFVEAAGDLSAIRYTFGERIIQDPYHVPIIRTHLTKHLAPMFSDIYDEVSAAFDELIPRTGDEWVSVHAIKVIRSIVARASNRAFVGLPLCRNTAFLDTAIDFTVDVAKARVFLALFPEVLKPLAVKMIKSIDTRVQECMQHLRPFIDERMRFAEELGDDWSDKPSDMLQWIIDEVKTRDSSAEEVVRMILLMNFAAIFTSSNSFTYALYHLAASPEFAAPLREEIEAVVAEDGWTKISMGKMWRLDSFLRESQRYNGINPVSVMRKAMKSFTLSDGTYIPKGTTLVTPALATHFDSDNYVNPTVFDPFRYVREKEQDMSAVKHQFVTTSPEYVSFGHGKHACPGRFFAANELKCMMAYVVVNYDVKLEKEGVLPKNVHTATSIAPNPEARVFFRRRKPSAA